ncbi:carbon-nitrogen hydrolase family protein [Robiginitalea sp. SC105]|uniref:carbon-nitrogen hydrolase family protein n=1 Tax=Robiginitalea sp. SC105 TaxID=2762332 RepID=UPI00163A35B8|nr:carbon-nitrogen hydrolase family protein [Robiginitalea sp. SC105]MBC2838533.1 carbon-nitrogen hydrolase family protein [Robiginitalea sp. SC105]
MNIQVAVIQESPVFFDKEACLANIESITAEHTARGCQLILFPESFVPGYPRGFTFGARVGSRTAEGRELYAEYHRQSVDLEGPDRGFLEKVARDHGVYLAVGITEKSSRHGSLYCSLAYFSPYNGLMGVHRKIKPTGTERIVWAEGDATTLCAFDTPIGRLGGLICWENYMPLARQSMYRKGVQVYLAPTADARPGWTDTMRHIALEGRCFVLGCNQFTSRDQLPAAFRDLEANEDGYDCPGGSVIVSPQGELLAGPLWDQAGVLTASLDLEAVTRSKLDFDPNGHYSRSDMFRFEVPGQPEIKTDNP